jgi:hypothetical protein
VAKIKGTLFFKKKKIGIGIGIKGPYDIFYVFGKKKKTNVEIHKLVT